MRPAPSYGMALRSYADRVHLLPDPDLARLTQRTACGRQAILIDGHAGLTPCRQCFPSRGEQSGLLAIWDICDDLDGRYNGTIRDDRPLGSIL